MAYEHEREPSDKHWLAGILIPASYGLSFFYHAQAVLFCRHSFKRKFILFKLGFHCWLLFGNGTAIVEKAFVGQTGSLLTSHCQ